jgi:hypothetical protein
MTDRMKRIPRPAGRLPGPPAIRPLNRSETPLRA